MGVFFEILQPSFGCEKCEYKQGAKTAMLTFLRFRNGEVGYAL